MILRQFVRSVLQEVKLSQVFDRIESKSFLKWAAQENLNGKIIKNHDRFVKLMKSHLKSTVEKWVEYAKSPVGDFLRLSDYEIEKEAALGLDWFLTCLFNKQTMSEDVGKLFDVDDPELGYIGKFILYKSKLNKKDLRSYKSPSDLYAALKQFSIEQSYNVDPTTIQNLEFFAKDDRGSIWIPKTVEASCAVGKGTQWCTSKYSPDDKRNQFNRYNKPDDPIYVYFDNKLKKRFQGHVSSLQLMDEDDVPVIHIPFVNLLKSKGIILNGSLVEGSENDLINMIEDEILASRMENVYKWLQLRSPWGYNIEDVWEKFIMKTPASKEFAAFIAGPEGVAKYAQEFFETTVETLFQKATSFGLDENEAIDEKEDALYESYMVGKKLAIPLWNAWKKRNNVIE